MPTLFATPFRAWFFSGSLVGALAIIPWILQFFVLFEWQPYQSWLWWHQHEMVYAFAVPFILGFLLTASANWTGESPIRPPMLMCIVLIWWSARFALLLDLPLTVLLAVELTPMLIAIGLLLRVLLRNKNYRNLIMVALLALLALSDVVQLIRPDLMQSWSRFSILTVIFLIVVFSGRVIPFFTARGLGKTKVEPIPQLEKAVLVLQGLVTVTLPFAPLHPALKVLVLMLGGLHLWRWIRWQQREIVHQSLLWSLHLAYLMITLSWFLIAWRGLDSLALHSLTVGGFGLTILAFSARVSLGHSGRALKPSPAFPWVLGLVFASVLLRVWLPQLFGLTGLSWQYGLAGLLWAFGFLLFTAIHSTIWWKPRIDGQPG